MAALENRWPTPAKSGGIKKHYSSYNRTSGFSTLSVTVTLSPFLLSFSLFLSDSRVRTRSSFLRLRRASRKMRNDRGSIQRCLFKIHERFYCNLPYRNPSQKGEQSHIERGGGEREREIVRLWPTFATIHQCRASRENKGGRKGRACTPRNILIVEFSVRAAYPLEPLCPLPGVDLLIINYSDHQVHPTPSSSRLLPCNIRGCVSKVRSFFYCGRNLKKNCNKCTRVGGAR